MKNAGLADPLLWNTKVQEGHKKHREHNLCCQNAALCVGIRVVVVVVLFRTMVLNKIVPTIPLFQRWELILTDRNCYDWLKNMLWPAKMEVVFAKRALVTGTTSDTTTNCCMHICVQGCDR